jgi:uncharacterized membrane protein YuzA (DUF378 family)
MIKKILYIILGLTLIPMFLILCIRRLRNRSEENVEEDELLGLC